MTADFVKKVAYTLKDTSQNNILGASSLSHGYPGPLLLFTTLDEKYPDEGWDAISHSLVIKIKELIESGQVENLSLFGGLAGCCFAIQSASKGKTRYQRLIDTLNNMLFTKAYETYIPPFEEKCQLKLPCSPELYDPISGVSGLCMLALQNQDLDVANAFLKKALSLCIALTEDLVIGPYKMPGWYIPRHFQFTQQDQAIFPKGNFNLGLAHGIPSVLALLSIAHLQGVSIDGQTEAIQKIADWLVSKKKTEGKNIYWENRCSFEEEVLGLPHTSLDGPVEGWCYGTPGIARTLFLAGKVLNHKEIQKLALEAFLGTFNRIDIKSHFSTPTFCHGLSGLLTLSRIMSRDCESIELETWIERIENELLSRYQVSYPFGFKDVFIDLFDQNQNAPMKEQDTLGVLCGSSGILLSLLAKEMKFLPWARIFLIEENAYG